MQEVWPSCNPATAPPYMSGYVAFTFLNNSGLVDNSRVFVTFLASQPRPPSTPISYFMQFNLVSDVWVGSFVEVNSLSINSLDYGYPISQFATGSAPYTVYLPYASNTTQQLFVAIDYPVSMTITEPSPSPPPPIQQVAAPGAFDTTDGNYYHLYDSSIRFSLDPNTTGINMQSNYTSFFGLPISAAIGWNGPYNTLLLGANFNRNTAFQNYYSSVGAIANANAQTQWQKLPIAFTSVSGGGQTDLRLASSLSAFSLTFDQQYLYNSGSYGLDWEHTTFNPGAFPLYLDVSGLGAGYTTYQLTSVASNTMTFAPVSSLGSNVTIPLPASPSGIQSQAFINGAFDSTGFNASGDATVYPTICQLLSTGFISGLFPQTSFTSSSPFGTIYLAQQNAADNFYKPNTNLSSNASPWYDLYSKTLHTLAGSTSPPYIDFLAVPGDSLMGFFSGTTIPINNNTRPSVFINLGSMVGTVLPNFTDNSTYNLTFPAFAGPTTIVYHPNGGGTPLTNPTSVPNAKVPFTLDVTYNTGIYSGRTLTTQIYVHSVSPGSVYSIAYPNLPGNVGFTNTSANNWTISPGGSP